MSRGQEKGETVGSLRVHTVPLPKQQTPFTGQSDEREKERITIADGA